MKRYDLVVVGAGPAGLMAAKVAAEHGLKVALVERKKVHTQNLSLIHISEPTRPY